MGSRVCGLGLRFGSLEGSWVAGSRVRPPSRLSLVAALVTSPSREAGINPTP